MSNGEPGWILDVTGEAINLAHVRRIAIGSKFQETGRVDVDGYNVVDTVFHVLAEFHYLPRTQWPVLAQNLVNREAAEQWIATRFWTLAERPLARDPFADHEVMENIVYGRGASAGVRVAQRIKHLSGMADVEVAATTFGWVVSDHRAGKSWDVRDDA